MKPFLYNINDVYYSGNDLDWKEDDEVVTSLDWKEDDEVVTSLDSKDIKRYFSRTRIDVHWAVNFVYKGENIPSLKELLDKKNIEDVRIVVEKETVHYEDYIFIHDNYFFEAIDKYGEIIRENSYFMRIWCHKNFPTREEDRKVGLKEGLGSRLCLIREINGLDLRGRRVDVYRSKGPFSYVSETLDINNSFYTFGTEKSESTIWVPHQFPGLRELLGL